MSAMMETEDRMPQDEKAKAFLGEGSHAKAMPFFGVIYLMIVVAFGLVPGTMLNYGYDYWHFLHPVWLVVPAVGGLALLCIHRMDVAKQALLFKVLAFALVLLLPFAFWFLRTRVHCFGGDGAVDYMPSGDFALSDWIPPLPWQGRLDGFGHAFVAKLCAKCKMFNCCAVLPSILATSVYSIFVGILFTLLALWGFRAARCLFAMIVTSPFIFNFFGNIDSYAFSLLMALVFLFAAISVFRAEVVLFRHLVALGVLWGIGVWTHPFHLLDGFPLAVLVVRWLKQFDKLRGLPEWSLPAAFGAVFVMAVKCSKFGNAWIEWEFAKPPPTFSVDTFTHWLNMLFLPVLPWIAAAWFDGRRTNAFKTALTIFLAETLVFFSMAFTLGVVDQFNYQHLLFFFLLPWVTMFSVRGLSLSLACMVVVCNLCLLIPMVAVHSTDRTIARAEALYPLDPCHHNRVMSWQTHLGLCLGDNLQDNKAVRRACLRAFADGARNAVSAGFRGGNHIYHTAFLYHYGEFDRGRQQLERLVKDNPQVVRWFLGERPAFIYMNRKRLWNDIGEILSRHHPGLVSQWHDAVDKIAAAAKSRPYYVKRPSYAITPY